MKIIQIENTMKLGEINYKIKNNKKKLNKIQ